MVISCSKLNLPCIWQSLNSFANFLPDNSESEYQVFSNGQLSQSSKFTLVKVKETIDDFDYSYKLDFENSQMLDQYVGVEDNELRMQSGSIAVDHVVQFYQRQ